MFIGYLIWDNNILIISILIKRINIHVLCYIISDITNFHVKAAHGIFDTMLPMYAKLSLLCTLYAKVQR